MTWLDLSFESQLDPAVLKSGLNQDVEHQRIQGQVQTWAEFLLAMRTKFPKQCVEWFTSGWMLEYLTRWHFVSTDTNKKVLDCWNRGFEWLLPIALGTNSFATLYTSSTRRSAAEDSTKLLQLVSTHMFSPWRQKTVPWSISLGINKTKWKTLQRWERVWNGLGKVNNVQTFAYYTLRICDVLDGGLGTSDQHLIPNSQIIQQTGKSKKEWLELLVKRTVAAYEFQQHMYLGLSDV